MDQLDMKILNILQNGIPISEKPFNKIAKQLEIEPNELILRIRKIKDCGYIRRVGAIFDSKKMGYESTLIGMDVPENKVEDVVEIINSFDQVTHNYYRNSDQGNLNNTNIETRLNIWFTLSTKINENRDLILDDISRRSGIKEIYEFPKRKLFKLKVFFDMGESKCLMK